MITFIDMMQLYFHVNMSTFLTKLFLLYGFNYQDLSEIHSVLSYLLLQLRVSIQRQYGATTKRNSRASSWCCKVSMCDCMFLYCLEILTLKL